MDVSVDEAQKIAETFKPESMRQVTKAEIKGMSPEAILKAKDEGRLTDLLTGTGSAAPAEEPPEGQLSKEAMKKLARPRWSRRGRMASLTGCSTSSRHPASSPAPRLPN